MSFRITILAVGSRGDVQPFVALGLGLQAAGDYAVTIAAAADYGDLVREYGLAFQPLVGFISTLVDPRLVADFLAGAGNPLRAAWHFWRQVNPIVDQLMRDCWLASRDADGLIVSTLGMYCGLHLAEKLQIPLVVAHLHPYTPTSSAPAMFFPRLPDHIPGQAAYNRLSHALANHGQWQVLRRPFNRVRRSLLALAALHPLALAARVRAFAPPIVYGYSATIAPPPADWNERANITGAWFLPHLADWQSSPELAAFLADGSPPVYVGFGSIMLGAAGDRITQSIVDALASVGQRGIIQRGWGDLGRGAGSANVLVVDSVPHDWLFARVGAVVHHGGAGVTAAALRAGVPSVVVPFLGDQYFWAERVAALGAGTAPLPAKLLSTETLAKSLSTVLGSPLIRERAAAIARHIASENGVQNAVALVERAFG